jgi:hypothetical protein
MAAKYTIEEHERVTRAAGDASWSRLEWTEWQLVGRPQTLHPKRRAPITAMRRPRISMCQRHTFDPASWPGGAGIPAFQAQRSWTTH